MLAIEHMAAHMVQRFILEISQAAVDLVGLQRLLNGARGHGANIDRHGGMKLAEAFSHQRNAGHGGRDDAQPQYAGQSGARATDILLQILVI
jgi:hypothetical protein